MKRPWENDSCATVQACYAVYAIPVAAALWCGVPAEDVNEELARAVPIGQNNALSRAILRHPYLKCLEPRIRAIHDAIDSGKLAACREDGRRVDEHVAYERRHVYGLDLKEWAKEIAPSERPAFLFDELERDTHSGISAEAYRTLQASLEAKTHQLAEANERLRAATEQVALIEAERNSLRAIVDNFDAHQKAFVEPGERSETTYLNIIGGLITLMLGKSPAGNPHSSFASQAAVIAALLGHYDGKPGISARTLEEKFAAGKKSLKAT
ncbi:ATP-binding protein [Burkholderia cenocepacia]|uniref:ATP-binding protein n=1 Tax=Burkholderia cenocepacia TaxID=95486 RepID=UPI00196B0C94|nr:ATP-binding protein [Burkholderia cenocepacia]MBN3533837.1 ATP-binding protein [Burkholderia cenocepacia]